MRKPLGIQDCYGTDGWTDRPTQQGVESRVRDLKKKSITAIYSLSAVYFCEIYSNPWTIASAYRKKNQSNSVTVEDPIATNVLLKNRTNVSIKTVPPDAITTLT